MTAGLIDEDMITNRLNWPHADTSDQKEQWAVGPRELYGLLLRRKLLIAAIVTAGTALSILAALYLPKTYTAFSMIVLEADDPNLLADTPETTTQQPNKTKMDTETDLIMSREFVGRVVDAMQLVENANFNTYLPETSPRSTAPTVDAEETGLRAASDTPVDNIFAGGEKHPPRPLPDLNVQRDRAVSVLLSILSVSRSGDSMAMTVAVSYQDPNLAASLANAVTRLFVDWSRETKRDNTKGAVEFLRQQAQELASNIAATERQIAEYGRENDVSSDPRDDLLRAAMQQLNEQLSVAQGDLTRAQSRLAEVKKDATGRMPDSDSLLASDFLTTLRNEEATALRERAQKAHNFGVNHPLLQEADAQITSVRALIEQEMQAIVANLENDVRVAEGRVQKLESDLTDAGRKLRQRSLAEIRLRELNRDLLTEQKLYDVVSGRLGKLDPYSEIAEPGARVVSVAEIPTSPSFPKFNVLVGGGFAGSLVLAFIMAMTFESLDSRVRSPKRLSQLLRTPVLASVPTLRRRLWRKAPNVFDHLVRYPRSAFSESFRSVYHACRRANAGRQDQVVMISSGLPLEGRTTTAIGLAVAAASDGSRAVLVELDPAAVSLHAMMKLYREVHSLESFFKGECALNEVLQPVPGMPNLDVLASSGDGEEMGDVLNSRHVEKLIATLRHDYDLIVIDAPPLLVVEDAVSIAASVDAVVVVAMWGRTTEEALLDLGERLRLSKAMILGAVLNGIEPRRRKVGARPSLKLGAQLGRYVTR